MLTGTWVTWQVQGRGGQNVSHPHALCLLAAAQVQSAPPIYKQVYQAGIAAAENYIVATYLVQPGSSGIWVWAGWVWCGREGCGREGCGVGGRGVGGRGVGGRGVGGTGVGGMGVGGTGVVLAGDGPTQRYLVQPASRCSQQVSIGVGGRGGP